MKKERNTTEQEVKRQLQKLVRENVLFLRKHIPHEKLQVIMKLYPSLSIQKRGKKYQVFASRFLLKGKRLRMYVMSHDSKEFLQNLIKKYNALKTSVQLLKML
jgi:hypothetical protein